MEKGFSRNDVRIIKYPYAKKERQSIFHTLKKRTLRGRWEGGSEWGIHVTPWLIHVNV